MKNRAYKLCIGICASALLVGCTTLLSDVSDEVVSERVADDAIRLNEAFNRATNAVILKNILRAKDRWIINFTTMSGIRSKPASSFTGTTTLSPLGLGNPSGPLQATTGGLTAERTSENEYNINPFAKQDGSHSLLKPTPFILFKTYYDAWPKDVVFLLFVGSVEFTIGDGEDEKTYKIVNSGDNFGTFKKQLAAAFYYSDKHYENEFARLGRDLPQHAGALDLKNDLKLDEKIKTPSTCGEVKVDVVNLFSKPNTNMENLEKLKALAKVKVSLKGHAEPTDNAIILSVCSPREITNVFTHVNPAAIKIVTSKIKDTDTKSDRVFTFNLRSFEDIIYYLGETLREGADKPVVMTPCKSVKSVPSLFTSDSGDLFKIHMKSGNKKFAIALNHSNEIIKALPRMIVPEKDPKCEKERTSTVMSILNQLLLLNQSKEFLQSPENSLR